jgi:hypothetical protein
MRTELSRQKLNPRPILLLSPVPLLLPRDMVPEPLGIKREVRCKSGAIPVAVR